ncbi:type II toxin-antitoxin system HipA family toxin [Gammaproteobacteria bacterium]|nr:type II toxin-antitoxin system HipA family toxin [Gammaproteobacteria bacterium]
MVARVETAFVSLWGEQVGAVAWLDERSCAAFEYEPAFLKRGLNISPLHMGLDEAASGTGIFSFPALVNDTFLGLPGLLADALPDKFGNSIIDAWLARNGRDSNSFSPVERLCYIGRRGMGALEFSPPVNQRFNKSVPIEVAELVTLAQDVMSQRVALDAGFSSDEQGNAEAIMDILRVGTSAGGARPKAVIAMNDAGKVVSGQADVPAGYDYWLLKFDGVSDLELGAPRGYGRIEYAYHLMARAAGIDMMECRLLEEHGRAHFLTRRFDRVADSKIHMQTLCGLAHYDFNRAGAYGYEQAFAVMRQLHLSKAEAIQQYRRMIFNVLARNQDDHTKNIAYLMGPDGEWRLSPAYDLTYSHNPAGMWTNQHQMSINGKRDHFTRQDLLAVGESNSVPRPGNIIDEVAEAVSQWPDYARDSGVEESVMEEIRRNQRMQLAGSTVAAG